MSTRIRISLATLAIAAIIFVLFVLPPDTEEPVGPFMTTAQVLRSKVVMQPGTEIRAADLFHTEVISVPVSLVDTYLTDLSPNELARQDPAWVVTRYIRPGEDMMRADVVPPEEYRQVPDADMEVISFPAEFDRVVGGQLWPGQLVSIYLYGPAKEVRDENQRLITELPQVELLAHHVWVVDVRTATGRDTGYETVRANNSAPDGGATPVDSGPFGITGLAAPDSGIAETEPASIITVAMSDTLKVRRLIELMGSMGYRAWVSLSPRQVIDVTVTPTPTQTPTITNTPTPTPSLTPTNSPTFTRTHTPSPSRSPTSAGSNSTTSGQPVSTPTRVAALFPTYTPTAMPCEYLLYGTQVLSVGGYGDHMDYAGANTFPRMEGMAQVHLEACENRFLGGGGSTVHAELRIEPERPLQISASESVHGLVRLVLTEIDKTAYSGGVVADVESRNVYLTGDPNLGEDYLPSSRVILAAWGTGALLVDGETKLEGLRAFVMYTPEGSRVPQEVEGTVAYQVLNSDQECCYNPDEPDNAYVGTEDPERPRPLEAADTEDRELYFWLYSDQEDIENFPSRQVFVNVLFDNVTELKQPRAGTWLPLPKTGEDAEARAERG